MQADVSDNLGDLLQADEEQPEGRMAAIAPHRRGQSPALRRYQVNVLVDAMGMEGAPVIYENNPSYLNLVGRVEQMAMMGALLTDFTLIKPGALHRANGGYLMLDALKVLEQPECMGRTEAGAQLRRSPHRVSTTDDEPDEYGVTGTGAGEVGHESDPDGRPAALLPAGAG